MENTQYSVNNNIKLECITNISSIRTFFQKNKENIYWLGWWDNCNHEDKELFILKKNNIIISYCLTIVTCYHTEKGCYISYIYTNKQNRNKGYATQLIKYLKSKRDSIVLMSEHEYLEPFYKKLGFHHHHHPSLSMDWNILLWKK